MGGFESASMHLDTGRRVDVIAALNHDTQAHEDYALLEGIGIRTIRDALRWHLIERAPGRYDWSSAILQIEAARSANVQVIWDLAHFGFPDWIDPWGADFSLRFADYAGAASERITAELGAGSIWSPINEISFWAFAGGDQGHFAPLGVGRGGDWKRQLVRATIRATQRIREVDPAARFLQPEPAIHIGADTAAAVPDAAQHTAAMFEAWDMIAGMAEPELGGRLECLDYVGVNYYANNQWMFEGRRVGMGEIDYRPFSDILREIWTRYGRPIVISETGAEGANFKGWLRYILGEVEDAAAQGVEIAGLCIYPISDYPGWTDDRHCPCGIIELESGRRRIRQQNVEVLRTWLARPGPKS